MTLDEAKELVDHIIERLEDSSLFRFPETTDYVENDDRQSPETLADAIASIGTALRNLEVLRSPDWLSHAICLGIRKGLFGTGSDDYASVKELGDMIADAIMNGPE